MGEGCSVIIRVEILTRIHGHRLGRIVVGVIEEEPRGTHCELARDSSHIHGHHGRGLGGQRHRVGGAGGLVDFQRGSRSYIHGLRVVVIDRHPHGRVRQGHGIAIVANGRRVGKGHGLRYRVIVFVRSHHNRLLLVPGAAGPSWFRGRREGERGVIHRNVRAIDVRAHHRDGHIFGRCGVQLHSVLSRTSTFRDLQFPGIHGHDQIAPGQGQLRHRQKYHGQERETAHTHVGKVMFPEAVTDGNKIIGITSQHEFSPPFPGIGCILSCGYVPNIGHIWQFWKISYHY